MKLYSLDLDFVVNGDRTVPHPVAAIYASGFTRRDPEGPPFLTPDCSSFDELDSEIDRLKRELEEIRKKARSMFPAEAKRLGAKAGWFYK